MSSKDKGEDKKDDDKTEDGPRYLVRNRKTQEEKLTDKITREDLGLPPKGKKRDDLEGL